MFKKLLFLSILLLGSTNIAIYAEEQADLTIDQQEQLLLTSINKFNKKELEALNELIDNISYANKIIYGTVYKTRDEETIFGNTYIFSKRIHNLTLVSSKIKEAKERIYYLLALKKNDICQQLNIKTYQGTSILHLSENEQAELGKLMWEYVRLLTEKISNKIIHMVYHC